MRARGVDDGPVRSCGDPSEARGFGRHDHACLSYSSLDAVDRVLGTFVRDGLADGLRVVYAADEPLTEAVRRVERWVPEARSHVSRRALQVQAAADTYGAGAAIDPEAQVAIYAEATRRALDDGLAGLRVVADVTPFLADGRRLRAFARYEHLADRHMATQPMSAICLCDRTRVDAEAIAQLACRHPLHRRADAAFGLHATRDGLALHGELDMSTLELLDGALADAAEPLRGSTLALDGRALRFLDHRSLRAVERYGEMCGGTIVLRGAPPVVQRLAELVALEHVVLETA